MNLFKQLFRNKKGQPLDARHRCGVVVYTSTGCQCSAEAIQSLRENGIEPLIVDIESDQEVRQEFGAGTPIVKVDGRVRFFGRMEPLLLRRLIEHRRRREEA